MTSKVWILLPISLPLTINAMQHTLSRKIFERKLENVQQALAIKITVRDITQDESSNSPSYVIRNADYDVQQFIQDEKKRVEKLLQEKKIIELQLQSLADPMAIDE